MKLPTHPRPGLGIDPSSLRGPDEFLGTRLISPAGAELPPALAADRFAFGGVNCYVAGSGPPLILVHSINAAASAAEVRPLFNHLQRTRTVFAPDLPGFGLSERRDAHYGPRLMTDALHALSDQVQQRCGSAPIDALAVSLGCEFLARAATERPAAWRRLALVGPTGLSGTQPRRGPAGSTCEKPWLRVLLRAKAWDQALYGWLTRPAVIRYFLKRTWGSESIDETLWAYDVLTARAPGARFAPLDFLSGALFSQDIHSVYEELSQPVWMSHGVRGDFADFSARKLVHDRGNWRTTTYQTGALPYFEMSSAFFADLAVFLGPASSPVRLAPAEIAPTIHAATVPVSLRARNAPIDGAARIGAAGVVVTGGRSDAAHVDDGIR